MSSYVGRVRVEEFVFDVGIDDLDAPDWSADLGATRVFVSAGTFWVYLLEGPRTGERALAALETHLPSRDLHLVGNGPFAPAPS